MKKILVWLSWGVDSAVSAYLLKKAGYDVTAWFMINYLAPEWEYCPTLDDIKVAKEVAAFLEITFFTFDYRQEYENKVLDYMYEWYKKWITPNPDVMCNKEIKFKMFLDEALELGFDYIATGHYARIVQSVCHPELVSGSFKPGQRIKDSEINSEWQNKTFHLLKWVDSNKDQSYFLAFLNQFQLSKSLFPIGHLEKSEVRRIAEEAWLPNAKRKDSQWICFVGKVDFTKFLEKKIDHKEWNIVDTGWKILWKHKWVFYYTIGQRRWIDLGWLKEPLFVIKKDILKNELIVWTSSDLELYSVFLYVSNFDFLAWKLDFPIKWKAKIRYRQEEQDVTVLLEKWKIKFEFSEKQRAITGGQIVTLYVGDELVASWIIE